MGIDQATHRVGGLQRLQRRPVTALGNGIATTARLRAIGSVLCLMLALAGLSFAGAAHVQAHVGHQHSSSKSEKAAVSQLGDAPNRASRARPDRGTLRKPATATSGIETDVAPVGDQSAAPLARSDAAAYGEVDAPETSATVSAGFATERPVNDAVALTEANEQLEKPSLPHEGMADTVSGSLEQSVFASTLDALFDALPAGAMAAATKRSGGQGESPVNCPCGASCGACASCTSSSCCSGMLTPVAAQAVSPAHERAMRVADADATHGGTVDPMPRPPNPASLI